MSGSKGGSAFNGFLRNVQVRIGGGISHPPIVLMASGRKPSMALKPIHEGIGHLPVEQFPQKFVKRARPEVVQAA